MHNTNADIFGSQCFIGFFADVRPFAFPFARVALCRTLPLMVLMGLAGAVFSGSTSTAIALVDRARRTQ